MIIKKGEKAEFDKLGFSYKYTTIIQEYAFYSLLRTLYAFLQIYSLYCLQVKV